MPNTDYQRHSFLGGEVSPSLYERADMDKFGKWFSKAENIRFRETGAFRNRAGFVKVADTKYNQAGQVIKLLSFEFNDEESFIVELGPNYARFFRNGSPIVVNDSVYELTTPFSSFAEDDLKYAQSGDTVFIVHPTYGIYELVRLQVDGTIWEIKKFQADILPMKEENENKNNAVSAATISTTAKKASISLPSNSTQIYYNVVFTYNGSSIFTATFCTKDELFAGIKSAMAEIDSSLLVTLDNDEIKIYDPQGIDTPEDFNISFKYKYYTESTLTANSGSSTSYAMLSAQVNAYNLNRLKSINLYCYGFGDHRVIMDLTTYPTMVHALEAIRGQNAFSNAYTYSDGADVNLSSGKITLEVHKTDINNGALIQAAISLTGDVLNETSVSNSSTSVSETLVGTYTMTSTDTLFFNNMAETDCVLVKHSVNAQELKGTYSAAGTYTLGPIKSDGNWRFYTLGNWVGDVTIQYSTDNQQTWVDYYKWASQDANDTPANINTSGSLVADDLVWFRVVSTISSTGTKPLQVFFVASSFTVNSYYKIIFKTNSYTAIVKCIKNDVGVFSNNYRWRLPAFSSTEGWPQTVAFYQNRLFFGKDYIVYGSRSNDFWDFYEPTKLQADDPITMSLLSQKVNNIKNLVTQRSFFTFTGGGEFGIGSEGALTQNDKYLKPFSSNGSAQCTPVLISDVVLFVDKSYNSVRALKYALESDGYEAPDITLTLKSLLEGEKIISTDIIYEEKEALFLSDTGTIWCLKYITDQNVLSWSHWRHAFGKITNMCVVPNGPKHDLYIAVQANGKKWIEKMAQSEFMDTVEVFAATQDSKVSVTGVPGDKKAVIQGDKRYFKVIDSNGQIECPADTETEFKVGSVYTSTATLLSPVIQTSDYSHSNYEVKNPFKVFFYYLNSHGFKVGVEEDEKMEIEWQAINADIDDEKDLTSGKKSVLIPSRFDGSARVSFVQEEPYPMEVADVLIQTDYGGK